MRVRTGSSLITIICCSVASVAQAAAPLQPLKPWGVNYGATQCTATRTFGDPASPVTLGIVPSLSGSTYVLQVSEPQPGPHFAQEADGTVDFGGGAIRSEALYFGAGGVNVRAHQFRIMAAEMEKARSASSVSLRGVNGASFDLTLADMPALLDALRKCTDDLQRSWNLGGGLRTPQAPLGNITDMFVTSDLPREAMEKQKTTQYQVLVDEKGAVAGCDVLAPSGSALVDTEGCQLVSERARFKAALDTSGKAVRSVWTSPRVTWRTNTQALDNGCSTMGGSGASLNLCGQSPTANMLEKSGYGGGAPGRTPPR